LGWEMIQMYGAVVIAICLAVVIKYYSDKHRSRSRVHNFRKATRDRVKK